MHVFDVRADVKAEFEKNGAIVASDLPSLAQACDVIMICVPTSADVRTVVFEKSGLVEGLSAGTIIVDQTTGDPVETRSIAAKLQECGATLVDAPVSGGPRGAAAGTIAIMCGGPPEAYEQVKPLLNSISPNIVYCGTTGNGHVAKLVNNAVAACNRMITYECAAVGVKYGLSLELMSRVINKSSGWNGASERILPVLSSGGQTANFRLDLFAKDLKLATQMGVGCRAPLLITNTVRSLFEIAANEIGSAANLDEISHMFEAMADVKFANA
jgi:3-hydroxyisobutyrate dehydrogenase